VAEPLLPNPTSRVPFELYWATANSDPAEPWTEPTTMTLPSRRIVSAPNVAPVGGGAEKPLVPNVLSNFPFGRNRARP
jgi:hypothetical protein